jgi:hypothetical protein
MTYTTKHEIGDMVWALVDNCLTRKEIMGLEIRQAATHGRTLNPPRIVYSLVPAGREVSTHCFSLVPEERVAKTKEEVVASLLMAANPPS